MSNTERVLKELRAVLELDNRVNVHSNPIALGIRDGMLVLEGEVYNLAAKKLALEYAAALAGEIGIEDRLLVKPAEVMEDGALCDLVFAALTGESAFADTPLRAWVGGVETKYRGTPREPAGSIEIKVEKGVVTLSGQVESYAHKALAGVLSWWRGTRDVVDTLAVEHPMDDPDGEMTDALRIVLEKDRFVNAAQIRAFCHDFTATLEGGVKSETEKGLAEADAWYLFGVADVENRLVVLA